MIPYKLSPTTGAYIYDPGILTAPFQGLDEGEFATVETAIEKGPGVYGKVN